MNPREKEFDLICDQLLELLAGVDFPDDYSDTPRRDAIDALRREFTNVQCEVTVGLVPLARVLEIVEEQITDHRGGDPYLLGCNAAAKNILRLLREEFGERDAP